MSTPRTPNTARVEEVLRRLGSADFAGTAELLDPDFVQEYPYPPTPQVPQRIEGRAAAMEFLQGGMSSFDPYSYRVVGMWQTTDPATVITEYTSHTRLLDPDTPYSNHYMGVFVFGEDGKLTLWREFINPVTVIDLFERAAAGTGA